MAGRVTWLVMCRLDQSSPIAFLIELTKVKVICSSLLCSHLELLGPQGDRTENPSVSRDGNMITCPRRSQSHEAMRAIPAPFCLAGLDARR